MNFYERNEAEFLTTIGKWDSMELIARSGDGPSVLVAIEVQPRHARTGLLEERGRWIHTVWDAALSRIPEVAGQRMMWSQLLFVCGGADIQVVESQFAEILRSCKAEELESLCVLSTASGMAEVKLAEVDRMFEGLGKERNFGDPARFERWLLDGERYVAASSPRNI
jgi:hypothetical protein